MNIKNLKEMSRIINTIFINISIVILILFLIYTSYNMKNIMIQTSKIEITYSNLKDSIIKTDDISLLREKILILENDIKRVDELNNKRFEMLGWGFGILISTFAILLLVSYVNSKATMRDTWFMKN